MGFKWAIFARKPKDMNQPKFKKGDWVFCEFVLQQVKSTADDRINGVTTGIIEMGGRDLSDRCFPLNMDIKVVSDAVAYWSKKFHAIKSNSLNHPDLHRALVDIWVEMCENIGNEKKLKILYDKLDKFGAEVESAAENLQYVRVDDVRIFR